MTISLDSGISTTGKTASTMVTQRQDLSAIYRVKSEKPGSVILTDINAPLDRPTIARFGFQDVADIYKGTGISPEHQSPSTRGSRILIALSSVAEKTDDVDATYKVLLPQSVHLVMNQAVDDKVDVALIESQLATLLGLLQDEGTATRIADMLRGAIKPNTL